jgi:predicted MFS family arabinose efflux permease
VPEVIQRPVSQLQTAVRHYPRPLLLLAVTNFVVLIAQGMTFPFLVIFFGQVLGMGEGLAGAGIAVSAIGGVIFTLLVAGFIDRSGAPCVLLLTTLGLAVVTAVLPLATTWPTFFLVMVLYGCADHLYWPALEAQATALVPTEQAGETFAVLRVGEALGFGLGGLVGGLIVAGGTVDQYRILFLASAAGTVVSVLLILALVRTPRRPADPSVPSAERGSWWEVLGDRRFMFSQFVMLLMIAGLSQVEISGPPYLRAQAGVTEDLIGLLFAVNTVLVVAGQIWVARRIAGWRRGITLSITALVWVGALALIGAGPWGLVFPFAGMVVYTLGELLFIPISGVLVVELSPATLRGRYFALNTVVWGISGGMFSGMSGMILESQHPALLWPVLIVILLAGAVGGVFFDRLRSEATPPETSPGA